MINEEKNIDKKVETNEVMKNTGKIDMYDYESKKIDNITSSEAEDLLRQVTYYIRYVSRLPEYLVASLDEEDVKGLFDYLIKLEKKLKYQN